MSGTRSAILLERMMALHPKRIDLTLGRVEGLLARLGHPEARLPPVIHIAGTNGKGSTLAMLRAGLEAAGQTCHAYTSPHLIRFHERIRLAGELIGEAALAGLLERCLAANDGAPITHFEITTAAALLGFAETPADWTLLEVGLGGRLDATNVVGQPRLTVVTPVSLDHQAFLGESLPQIAGEKAGIIKRGVPCVVGRQDEAAAEVIEARAARLGAPLLAHGQHWHVWAERGRLIFQDETGLLDLPPPALAGPHQIDNAGIALAALRHLAGEAGLPEAAYAAASEGAHWPGRLQRLRGRWAAAAPEAEIWLDGGHNPAAGAALAASLTAMPARSTHLIAGMLTTKDAAGFLAPLATSVAGMQAVPVPGSEAGMAPQTLAEAARAQGIPTDAAPDPETALARIAAADGRARILICGSLYLAGAVLAAA